MVEIVYASREMAEAVDLAYRFARVSSPILIQGESGTGKELIARLIHDASDRRERPFLPVDCSAIPETLFESEFFGYRAGAFTGAFRDKEGLFEAANGGTVFLDEIGNLPHSLQSKFLRVLQEGELRRVGETKIRDVDFRLISAANVDLEREVKANRFRKDLFFRISVLRIDLKPLRSRPGDIEILIDYFLTKMSNLLNKPCKGISPEAVDVLRSYHWPGNVRELENEIHRLVALSQDGNIIQDSQISARILDYYRSLGRSPTCNLRVQIEDYERKVIREALERYRWNKSEVARHLGITRQGLHKKIQKLGIIPVDRD
ncbi:MAG: sigma-54 interaction domain-containing protein [bacterium]